MVTAIFRVSRLQILFFVHFRRFITEFSPICGCFFGHYLIPSGRRLHRYENSPARCLLGVWAILELVWSRCPGIGLGTYYTHFVPEKISNRFEKYDVAARKGFLDLFIILRPLTHAQSDICICV